MAEEIYLNQIDYFKGARVLHHFEFSAAQVFKDEYFTEYEVHAVAICDYEGEETMLFYLDDDLEIIQEFEFMIPKQAKEQTTQDFPDIDIQWRNR